MPVINFPHISSGAMKVAGSLANEALAMYPATFNYNFLTRVVRFLNLSEQRWTVRRELFSCVLEFHDLDDYDVTVLRDFFVSQMGLFVTDSLSNTFTISIGGVDYQYCAFAQDDFAAEVSQAERYSLSLAIAQVRPNDP